MPHLTFALSADGMVVPALIGLNRPATIVLAQAGQPIPRPVQVRALIDSGCDVTAVAPHVFQQLGLMPIRSSVTQTAAGAVSVNLYRVSLTIFDSRGAGGPMFVQPNLLVTELTVALPNSTAHLDSDSLVFVSSRP